MQGRKDFTPKMLYQVHLDNLVPTDNFYRQLEATLDLQFSYRKRKSNKVLKTRTAQTIIETFCF